ncbi:hypothetical protein H5410_039431 [Solanum commersonii]|uniref:Uncharacterized protein n=1 Tax=Solanum commersonii TaxID=4109 RepID=A0A9J5XM33_SOLCO|nr:hypothetical protein H5410_039431 [Solanum commersonii]
MDASMSTRRNSEKVGHDEGTLKLKLLQNNSYFLLSLKVSNLRSHFKDGDIFCSPATTFSGVDTTSQITTVACWQSHRVSKSKLNALC